MRGLSILGLVLTTVALSGNPASAAAINYAAQEISFDSLGSLPGTIALPDLSQGGTVELGSFAYDNPQGGTYYPSIVRLVSGLFGFQVESSTGQGPGLVVTGQFQGTITAPGGDPPRWSGSLSGVVTQISPAWTQGSTIPEPLLDLISHPSRMHISTTFSVDASGSQSLMNVFLTIDPAAVPEPLTLVVMLATLVGVILRGKRRRVP